jgi:hypothetical protein
LKGWYLTMADVNVNELKLNTRISLKYDLYTNWETNNPVLNKGEVALAYIPADASANFGNGVVAGTTPPNVVAKVGNGTSHYNDLKYLSALAADVPEWAKAVAKPEYSADEINGLADFINTEIKDTDTQYTLVKVNAYQYKLMAKNIGDESFTNEVGVIDIPKYDDTAIVKSIADNTAALAVLNGTEAGSVAKTVSDAITALNLAGTYAPLVHTHTKSEITDFAHTHAISEVVDLPETLATLETKEDATAKLAEAKAHTDTEVGKVADAINTLENNIGYVAVDDKTLVEKIDEIFATKAELEAADGGASQALTDEITRATAKEAELEGKITAEAERAAGIEEGLRTDVDAIAADYLKAADKSELVEALSEVAQGVTDEEARATAKEAEIEGKITAEAERAAGIEAGLRTDVDAIKADYLTSADKEALVEAVAETYATKADLEGAMTDASKAISDEAARATAAEEALGGRIDELSAAHTEHTHSWDDLTDKPFYVNEEAEQITFDGNVSPYDIRINYGEQAVAAYKVSDRILTADELIGSVISVTDSRNSTVTEYTVTKDMLNTELSDSIACVLDKDNYVALVSIHDENNSFQISTTYEYMGISAETGTYVTVYDQHYISSITFHTAKCIDDKFISQEIARTRQVKKVEAELTALDNKIGFNNANPDTTLCQIIEETYATKEELEEANGGASQAVADEKARAEEVEAGLRTDIDAIAADYLKASDKEALVEAVAETYATKADLEGAMTDTSKAISDEAARAAAKEAELAGQITAEAERAAGIEAGLDTRVKAIEDDYLTAADKEALQTQINTIMNNPDTEGVINSINEFTQYVKDHGTIAEGFRTDIDKNKEDIAANAQAITDEIARAKAAEEANTAAVTAAIETAAEDATAKANAAQAAAEATASADATTKADTAKSEAIAAAAEDATTKANAAQAAAEATASADATEKAGTAKSEAIAAAAEDATTKAGTAKSEAIAAAAEDATSKANAAQAAAEATASADATTKAGTAKSEAIAAAAEDATTKANAAQAAAEATAAADATTKADTAKSEAIAAAAEDATSKANAAQAAAEATASADATEKANAAQAAAEATAKGYTDAEVAKVSEQVSALETWHENFVEITDDEIDALFA